jgi:hypothetical protein
MEFYRQICLCETMAARNGVFLNRIYRKGGSGIVVLESRRGLWFIERSAGL